MHVSHDVGRSITLAADPASEPVWRYLYAGKPKPYFHPMRTPAGHEVTLFEPHDHVWHRGLWFTFKFLNGENFWEEPAEEGYGVQVTTIPPTVSHPQAGRVRVEQRQEWVRPGGGGTILDEHRVFEHLTLGDDAYAIDFATTLTPRADVLLDRTPFTTWGGYGGIILRATRNWKTDRILLDDGQTTQRPTGLPARAADLSGVLDGGVHATGGVAMLDHPTNPRHPTPWYGKSGENHYLTAAPLFHEPLRLTKDEPIAFQYRVIIHDGVWDAPRLRAEWDRWTAQP